MSAPRSFAATVATALLCSALFGACGPGDEPSGEPDPAESAAADNAATESAATESAAGENAVTAPPTPTTTGRTVSSHLPGTDEPPDAPAAPPASDGSDIHATDADWAIVREKVEWAREQRLDLLPIGEVIAMIGSTFVGTTYVPHVLEAEGPERLIINLRQLDCVTFVEHVLVLSRLVTTLDDAALQDEERFRARYADALTTVRYRDGVLNGYPDRLHYFSEWISDGARKGLLQPVTAEIGGVPLPGAIDFMSSNPDAYRQLALGDNLAAIRAVEERLNTESRHYIPQARIGDVAAGIRNGDIIAATSTVDGLDVAHTGIALWTNGDLYLLHAPLIGSAVEVSERPLADRIELINGQDGIMVARPLPPDSPEA